MPTNPSNASLVNMTQNVPDDIQRDIAKKVLLGALLMCFSLVTSIGNAMVLHAVRTEKRLQTVCNMFIVSLATADVTVGTFVMPVSTVYALTGDWIFGRPMCQLWLAIDYTASTASILNLLILSLDRYWSVSSPLLYLPKRTKSRARLMIFLAWLTSALWIIPIFGWHKFANRGVYTIPDHECDTEYKENFPLKIVTGIFNFFIPLFVMYFLYGKIFLEIRKRSDLEKFQSMRRKENHQHRSCCKSPPTNSIANGSSTIDLAPLTQEATDANCDKPAASASSDQQQQASASDPLICQHVEFIYDELIVDQTTERVEPLLLRESRVKLHGDEAACSRCLLTRKDVGSSSDDGGSSSMMVATAAPGSSSSAGRRIRFVNFNTSSSSGRVNNREEESGTATAAGVERCELHFRSNRELDNVRYTKGGRDPVKTGPVEAKRAKVTDKGKKLRFRQSSSLKKEIKAARQLGVIMGAFTACFMPYFVTFVVVAFCSDCISGTLMLTLTWIGYANSALNPVLYPLCNQAFRRKFRLMLGCLWRSG